MIAILATDTDVTVVLDGKTFGSYDFGLTGSDLAALLEELGIEAAYTYRPHSAEPTEATGS